MPASRKRILVPLTLRQLERLTRALDAYVYWECSDENYRDNGYVNGQGSDDPEQRLEMLAARRLERKLDQLALSLNPQVPA